MRMAYNTETNLLDITSCQKGLTGFFLSWYSLTY